MDGGLNRMHEAIHFFCGHRGILRQFANFTGHHGKAASLLARASRFDRRIQRQQVGLRGNILNSLNDQPNLF